jgi:hypothetical protein
MLRRLAILVPGLAVGLLFSAAGGWVATQRKMDLIEKEGLRPASRVSFPAAELNAWIRHEAARTLAEGVRDPVVELGTGTATGSALIDFSKLRRAQGEPPGWLMERLLDGERPVRVVAAWRSGGGKATVDVQSVEISGVTISGPVLDFLIRDYVLPNYPGARIGEPFELGHRIERIGVRPAAVDVLIGR